MCCVEKTESLWQEWCAWIKQLKTDWNEKAICRYLGIKCFTVEPWLKYLTATSAALHSQNGYSICGDPPESTPMSSRRALEVQHLKYPSFLLESHFQKGALLLPFFLKHPKRKGNKSIEKGIRSKVKCRSSAHIPPIWADTPGLNTTENLINSEIIEPSVTIWIRTRCNMPK